jgi:hypothetical protein
MLRATKKAALSLYAKKTGKSESELSALMTAATWYTGEEAVAAGFADALSGELPKEKEPSKSTMQIPEFSLRETLAGLTAVPQFQIQASEVLQDMPEVTKPASTPAAGESTAIFTATVQSQPSLSLEQAQKIASDAATKAVADERTRSAAIMSLCALAKCESEARKFIDEGTPLAEVQATLFKKLCEERKPLDDGGQGGAALSAAEPNEKFKAEYKSNPYYAKMGLSVEDYVAQRRIDEGLELVTSKPKAS